MAGGWVKEHSGFVPFAKNNTLAAQSNTKYQTDPTKVKVVDAGAAKYSTETAGFYIINPYLPMFLKLQPNPVSIDFNTKKFNTRTKTVGGWVFEHGGSEPDIMRVAGFTSARMAMNDTYLGITMQRDVKVETMLIQLQQLVKLDTERVTNFLKTFKDRISANSKRLLGGATAAMADITNVVTNEVIDTTTISETYIYYKGIIYQGFFNDFHYREDARDPRRYAYDFSFTITFSTIDWLMGQILKTPAYVRTFVLQTTPVVLGGIRAKWSF